MTKKWVYLFEEGRADMRMLLGGKGANLAEMTVIGLPVPPGFTITTEVCLEYQKTKRLAPEVVEQVDAALAALEQKTGKKFGDTRNPLLLSVRSGAPVSMPGMMDTVLNLGLNDETVQAMAELTNNERFAWDSYRRFIQMFGNVVLGIELHNFESILEAHKRRHGFTQDIELQAEHFKAIVPEYKAVVEKHTGKPFPTDPRAQLMAAINAVFESWDNPRAQVYRRINKIPDTLGTAVNVQVMAFGNMGDDCATGVCFTRNPNSGVDEFYGEYLPNAQGEDVVAGIRTPYPISHLKETMPEVYQQLYDLCELLESHYKDMQDIEFTVERGKLWMLQTRAGKRTPVAAIKIAVDLVKEGKISKEQAILRVDPEQVDKILHPAIDPSAKLDILAKGLAASPGAASGVCVFDPDRAVKMAGEGKKVILVRPETSPDDIHGMVVAQGILTSRGGMTSHAAIVSRGMGKPCVVGCEAIKVDLEAREFTVNGRVIREGDVISIDGASGNVIAGEVPVVDPELSPRVRRRGHRPLPHGAHVWPGRAQARADGDGPRDDSRRDHRRAARGPGEAREGAARGLLRDLQGDEPVPGDHPPAGSAAA